ncbi:MAG: dienelactone hydrolase family protein [Solirubrobacterales bacterium]|nr:dienelactone hydrolase family protein [Solirubrobacterales bacterium]
MTHPRQQPDNPHLAEQPVLAGAPLDDAPLAAVLVHGREQGPEVMLDVAERLALDDVAYVLPAAAGRSWYPARYFDPVSDNEPHVSWSLAALEAAIALARTPAARPLNRIVFGGFSQGACLVAELVARRPRPFAGVAVLTGTLLGPDGQEAEPGAVDGVPMFFASSRHDEWVPLARARSTAEAFRRAGARLEFEVYDDREHHVSDRAVDGLRRLITSALADR